MSKNAFGGPASVDSGDGAGWGSYSESAHPAPKSTAEPTPSGMDQPRLTPAACAPSPDPTPLNIPTKKVQNQAQGREYMGRTLPLSATCIH